MTDQTDSWHASELARYQREVDEASRLELAIERAEEEILLTTPAAARDRGYLDNLESLEAGHRIVVRICAILDLEIQRLAPAATCEQWLSGEPIATGIDGVSIVGLDFDGCATSLDCERAAAAYRIEIDTALSNADDIRELADRVAT